LLHTWPQVPQLLLSPRVPLAHAQVPLWQVWLLEQQATAPPVAMQA
jgi:hypothetical protein